MNVLCLLICTVLSMASTIARPQTMIKSVLPLKKDAITMLNTKTHAGEKIPATVFNAKQETQRKALNVRVDWALIVSGGQPPLQVPQVLQALRILRGDMTPSSSYPAPLSVVPAPITFSCDNVHQAGFYADQDFGCQVFRRCDRFHGLTSYLCGEQTLFNQITLVCDYYYNVDCSRSSQFVDYSNTRLYHNDWPLFDDAPDVAATAATTIQQATAEATTTTQVPVTEPSTTEVLVTVTTTTAPPVTDTPVTQGPDTEPTTTYTEIPVTDTTVTDVPVTDTTVTNAPVTDTTGTNAPVTDTTVTNAPVTDTTNTDVSVTDTTVTNAPVTDTTVTNAPVTDTTVTNAPVTDTTVTVVSVTDTTTIEGPVTAATTEPNTDLPVTDATSTATPESETSATTVSTVTTTPTPPCAGDLATCGTTADCCTGRACRGVGVLIAGTGMCLPQIPGGCIPVAATGVLSDLGCLSDSECCAGGACMIVSQGGVRGPRCLSMSSKSRGSGLVKEAAFKSSRAVNMADFLKVKSMFLAVQSKGTSSIQAKAQPIISRINAKPKKV
ncbi:hypothetical protein BV898_17087 [Hypsibius exemplaris]|uniref:Chitin-binding type-2 domain-containing protein n=1 Tax=Hypsibius exemplaris TaxID=2072580 RepID=A0A9X6RM39_HYPEX|nr:hypothetical protein BV898_17087 [Hypsibius exemplaris]